MHYYEREKTEGVWPGKARRGTLGQGGAIGKPGSWLREGRERPVQSRAWGTQRGTTGHMDQHQLIQNTNMW
jgi:hypothetical protein